MGPTVNSVSCSEIIASMQARPPAKETLVALPKYNRQMDIQIRKEVIMTLPESLVNSFSELPPFPKLGKRMPTPMGSPFMIF